MINTINTKTISILMRGQIPMRDPQQVKEAAPAARQDYSRYRTQKDQIGGGQPANGAQPNATQRRPEPVKAAPKIGRNDPCPCGSGKKYKNCHGREA